ncbi:MAG TPA: virulence protein RhuM/Fic/DOC family protein [Candidatus Binatia bacterium]|nr:virulence protein RhuM/Fic/DOC family protein [Candidatus Binatia bacterium]
MTEETKGEIILYKDKEGPELRVVFENESVWLNLQQIADLFQRDKSVISRHIKNIFKEAELSQNSVVANYATTGSDGKTYKVDHYNLDLIISVGYRVNSKRGIQFRAWATQKLKEYLLKGYIINEKRLREAHENRLKELQQAHSFLRQAFEAKRLAGYEKELASIINDYTQTWVILNRYDEGDLEVAKQTKKPIRILDYVRAKKAVEHFRDRLMDTEAVSGTFGREQGNNLAAIIKQIEVEDASIEEKAALLFYLIIKNRPFVDGNKRVASLLFVVFLIENDYLYDKKGERKFNDNALIAMALLVEETKPSEKDTLIRLISNLITKK